MGGAVVYIVYALDDHAEVSKIAEAVRNAGWSVCFGHTADPAIDPAINQQRLRSADCVLAIWSAYAASSSVLRSDALEAAAQHKLVQVSLDDAAPPARSETTVRLREWCDGADEGAIDALISEISDHAGSGRGRGSIVPYVSFQIPKLAWLKGGAAALCGVAIALALAFGLSGGPPGSDAGAALTLQASPSVKTSTAPLKEVGTKFSEEPWEHAGDGASKIRGLLQDASPATSDGVSAVGSGDTEQIAWRNILDHRDLPTQLRALESFRDDYSAGEHRFEAAELAGQKEAAMHEVRTNLVFLGFIPPRGGNDLIELRAAVEAFEASIGLRPSGAITQDLIDALARAAQAKSVRSH
ncbi:MAG: toll/interleukin-1 receptor domain-containing protein [Hyphomonadaceae bacterium]